MTATVTFEDDDESAPQVRAEKHPDGRRRARPEPAPIANPLPSNQAPPDARIVYLGVDSDGQHRVRIEHRLPDQVLDRREGRIRREWHAGEVFFGASIPVALERAADSLRAAAATPEPGSILGLYRNGKRVGRSEVDLPPIAPTRPRPGAERR